MLQCLAGRLKAVLRILAVDLSKVVLFAGPSAPDLWEACLGTMQLHSWRLTEAGVGHIRRWKELAHLRRERSQGALARRSRAAQHPGRLTLRNCRDSLAPLQSGR